MTGHRILDGAHDLLVVLVLQLGQVELLLFTQMGEEERLNSVERGLEPRGIAPVVPLELRELLTNDRVVELHRRRRERVTQPGRDLRVEPALLGFGVAPQIATEELEHAVHGGQTSGGIELGNDARDRAYLLDTRTQFLVPVAQGLGQGSGHRLEFASRGRGRNQRPR